MNFERDLREALHDLAGDPVADAERVLAALPPGAPRGTSPRPFVLLAAAMFAAGLAIGWWCWSGPSAPAKATTPPAVAGKPDKPMPDKPTPEAMAEQLQFVALDAVEIDEPGEGVQHVEPGVYRTRVGTKFTTGRGLVGAHAYASDAAVRFASDTVAVFAPQLVKLAAGTVWVRGRARPVDVRTELASIEVAAAIAIVEQRSDVVFVACLAGEVAVRTTAGKVLTLPAGQQRKLDREGPGSAVAIPFAATLTSWLVPLLFAEADDTELRERAANLVDAWLVSDRDNSQHDAIERELRRLGSHAVVGLHKHLDAIAPERRAAAAVLIRDLADFRQGEWLLTMLAHADADVRVAAWRALTRVTGARAPANGENEAFWRAEPGREHELAAQRWRLRTR